MKSDHKSVSPPDNWVAKFAQLIPFTGQVLDLACGYGRHSRLLASSGHSVMAIDKDLSGCADLQAHPKIELLKADLESDTWPLEGTQFAGIVVVNYLFRPRLASLIDHLQDDGVLIYSTFAAGNEQFGRPRNPDFLLQKNELQQVFGARLRVLNYQNLTLPAPNPAVRQQICAAGPEFVPPPESA